jgi:outer membrane murein-binding lipoprotein Lpp
MPNLHLSGHGVRLQLPGVLVTAIVAALASGGVSMATRADPVPADVRALTMAVDGLSSKVTALEGTLRATLERLDKAETEASLRAIELARVQGRLDSVTPR